MKKTRPKGNVRAYAKYFNVSLKTACNEIRSQGYDVLEEYKNEVERMDAHRKRKKEIKLRKKIEEQRIQEELERGGEGYSYDGYYGDFVPDWMFSGDLEAYIRDMNNVENKLYKNEEEEFEFFAEEKIEFLEKEKELDISVEYDEEEFKKGFKIDDGDIPF